MVAACSSCQTLSKMSVFRRIPVGKPMATLCRGGVVNTSTDRLVGQMVALVVVVVVVVPCGALVTTCASRGVLTEPSPLREVSGGTTLTIFRKITPVRTLGRVGLVSPPFQRDGGVLGPVAGMEPGVGLVGQVVLVTALGQPVTLVARRHEA